MQSYSAAFALTGQPFIWQDAPLVLYFFFGINHEIFSCTLRQQILIIEYVNSIIDKNQ
jgi:hypothetical protein